MYSSERVAQRQLRLLWEHGVLERAAIRRGPGEPALAYRLAPETVRRLRGTAPPRQRPHLRHDLDTLDVVCALARNRTTSGPVSLWLTESMARGLPSARVRPDALLVLQLPAGSCVLCIEVDEATEHAQLIRRKLAAYRQPLLDRPGWRLLVAVPDVARVDWMRRIAATSPLAGRSFVGVLPDLSRDGLAASVVPLVGPEVRVSVATLASDGVPRSAHAPLGSAAWRQLLASGGAEDTVGLLHP